MIAVADSSPIILLAKIGRLDLLRDLFAGVIIPPAVHAEIVRGRNRPDAAELDAAPWIAVRSVTNKEEVLACVPALGPGESEAIALAQEIREPVTLLIDDAAGRRRARERGVLVLGTVGVLVQSKEQGLIPLVRPLLDELRAAGLYLTDALYGRLLAGVGEAPEEPHLSG